MQQLQKALQQSSGDVDILLTCPWPAQITECLPAAAPAAPPGAGSQRALLCLSCIVLRPCLQRKGILDSEFWRRVADQRTFLITGCLAAAAPAAPPGAGSHSASVEDLQTSVGPRSCGFGGTIQTPIESLSELIDCGAVLLQLGGPVEA